MKLASYNVENLFMRARALSGPGFSAEGRQILKAHADVNTVLSKHKYTPSDNETIVELLDTLGLKKSTKTICDPSPDRGHLVSGQGQPIKSCRRGETGRVVTSAEPHERHRIRRVTRNE